MLAVHLVFLGFMDLTVLSQSIKRCQNFSAVAFEFISHSLTVNLLLVDMNGISGAVEIFANIALEVPRTKLRRDVDLKMIAKSPFE